jgi:hypothetical protein
MNPYEPRMISLDMTGERRLYQRDALAPIIQALADAPLFAPETWGLDERSANPFDTTQALRNADGEASQYILQLRRKKRLKHTTFIRLSDRPALIVELPEKTRAEDWHHLFSLGDSLSAAYQPDIAWAHLFSKVRPPLTTADAETQWLIDSGVVGSSSLYYDYGPGGLGLRTYLGPRLVALFGRDLLLSTPAQTTELDWGGIRLDLVAEPWQAAQSELHAAWRVAMEHLRPARVFAEMTLKPNGAVRFTRGDRFTLEVRG